jgi:hypothetical protein
MMLIGLLSFGMFIGCPTSTGSGDTNEATTTGTNTSKVIAEQYRGTWKIDNGSDLYIILTENTCKIQSNDTHPAWTEGTDLWNDLKGTKEKIGYFQSDDTFIYNYNEEYGVPPSTYKKQ